MITIKSGDSRIVNNDGSLATGFGIITANESFQFTDASKRRTVTLEAIKFTYTSGVLDASFSIAPTLNATQSNSNLYYKVQFITNDSHWTEYWIIDASGSSEIEITSVTKVTPSAVANTTDFISSDTVSVVPIANGVPRAGEDGTIDIGWLIGIPGGTPVYDYSSVFPLPNLGAGVLGIAKDQGDGQLKIWNETDWKVVGG